MCCKACCTSGCSACRKPIDTIMTKTVRYQIWEKIGNKLQPWNEVSGTFYSRDAAEKHIHSVLSPNVASRLVNSASWNLYILEAVEYTVRREERRIP